MTHHAAAHGVIEHDVEREHESTTADTAGSYGGGEEGQHRVNRPLPVGGLLGVHLPRPLMSGRRLLAVRGDFYHLPAGGLPNK